MPQRVTISAEQAGRLVAEQFPHWAALPVTAVENGGWDNRTFHLGDTMLLRLPSAEEYALAVEKEHRWLPELAPALPLPIPVPLAKGSPGATYPFAWSVFGWIDGTPAKFESVVDPIRFAEELAKFVAALQSIDASEGPQPGKHNCFRGATLRTYEAQALGALDKLHGRIDVALARKLVHADGTLSRVNVCPPGPGQRSTGPRQQHRPVRVTAVGDTGGRWAATEGWPSSAWRYGGGADGAARR